jgi:hypothetical protein
MQRSSVFDRGLLMVFLLSAVVFGMPSFAQDPDPAFDQIVGQPVGLPQLPPQGAWGEVINVTTRWIVIQNHSGQQFPISIDNTGEFLVRWPTMLERLTAQSLVEAVGRDVGSNVLQAPHADVFEGSDRTLVSPTFNSLLPNNALVTVLDPTFSRTMSPWDYAGQSMLYGWAYPVSPGIEGIPSRAHVVGSVVSRVPLQLSVPGNNIATVVPSADGEFTISQVTRGSMNFVRKGDYAFMLPLAIRPKGLLLSQLVVYKNMPFREFNAAAR